MINLTNTIQKYTVALIILAITLLMSTVVYAQAEPNNNGDLILTWEAQNYYPSNYQGKADVTQRTPVLVSATGAVNNSFVDLSNAEFLWYLDGSLYKKGVGLSEIIFEASKSFGDNHFVRVIATLNNTTFKGATSIPVNKPKAIIEYPYTSRTINKGESIRLASTPYFFTVNTFNNLSFFWEVNGLLQDNKTRNITISANDQNIDSGYNLIKGIIANNANRIESSRSSIQINVK